MGSSTDPGHSSAYRGSFYDHLRESLTQIKAIAPAATPPGTADDALRGSVPGQSVPVSTMMELARLDPRYAAWREAIDRNTAAIAEVHARQALLLEELAADLDTPYAEFDGESGNMVAAARERAEELLVLMAPQGR